MDLTQLSLDGLKALAYDQMVLLNQFQKNIHLIEQEIANRDKPEPPPQK